MRARSRLKSRLAMAGCTLALLSMTACGKNADSPSASSANDSAAVASAGSGGMGSQPSGTGVCALLTVGEAKAAFPDVESAKPDDSRADMGIKTCTWENASGAMVFELRVSKSTPEDEFGMLGMGVMGEHDTPPHPEIVEGVEVVVFDQKLVPGVRQDMAIAALQKGKQTVDTLVNDLGTDRSGLKERLAKLTKAAADRLS